MDATDRRMHQMATIDAIGGVLAGDRAVLDSPASRHVFTFHVATGRLLALATDDDSVSPYSLTSAASDLGPELRALREQETEKWDGVILRLDKNTGSLRMQFLFGTEADLVDPAVTPLVDLVEELGRDGR